MMFRNGQDLPWIQFIAKNLHYLQIEVALWTYAIIFDEIIPNKPFLRIFFCDFDFSFIFTKNACFQFTLCSNVTEFYSLLQKKIVQNPLWEIQVCPEFINVIMENNPSHKYGANSTLYNVAIQGFPLLPLIFIWTSPICLAVKKCLSANFNIFIRFHQWDRYKNQNI